MAAQYPSAPPPDLARKTGLPADAAGTLADVRTRLSSLVLVALLSTTAGAQSPKPRIAVLTLRAEGAASGPTANLLTEVITTELAHSGKFQVLSSSDIATMLGFERQKQLLGCDEGDSCMAEIGAALGSEILVSGSVGKLGEAFVLTVSAYDTVHSKPLGRETVTVDHDSSLELATRVAVTKLFSLPPPVLPKPKPKTSPGWFVLGGGGVLALGGLTFGLLALNDYNQFKVNPSAFDAYGTSAQWKGYVADGMYGAAIVAGVVSLVMLLTQPHTEQVTP